MPKELDDCVRALMADPDFKPQAGRTKEESAYAVCQAKLGKKRDIVKFFAPIVKRGAKIEAILSDTSIDRDNEIIGKDFLVSAAKRGSLPALMDHENKAMNLIAEWTNLRVEKREVNGEEHHALIAEPRFFLSNPNAKIIHDMIRKDNAPVGISITAIPEETDSVEINGVTHKRFVNGEMLSADFVGIPSNRHAAAFAIAKSFSIDEEVLRVEDKSILEELKKEFSALKESMVTKDVIAELEKRIDGVKEELLKNLEELTKKDNPAEKSIPEKKVENDGSNEKVNVKKKIMEREKELEEMRKKLPEANTGSIVSDDGDVGVGGIIKAFYNREVLAR